MHRLARNLLVALACAAVSGCGGGGGEDAASTSQQDGTAPAAAAAKATDPCSLVTAEEVAQIIGDKIAATTPGDGSCTYATEDAQAASVIIELDQADAAGKMDIARRTAGALQGIGAEAAKEGPAGEDVKAMLSDSGEAPKIGDEAFFGANNELSVRKGSSYIAISPPMMRSRMAGGNPLLSSDDKRKMAVAIAERAVSRLP